MNTSISLYSALLTSMICTTAALGTESPKTAPASIQDECPDAVPAALAPAADQRLRFKRAATGVQIYVCSVKPTGEFTWLFVAPEANLSDKNGKFVGTHSIGPVWQGNDGSLVKGAKVSEAPSPESAIPWLLLKSVANSGEGRYSKVSSIQRLNTVGGLAPDIAGCTNETLGTISQVPYTADYYFYDTHTPKSGENLQCRS